MRIIIEIDEHAAAPVREVTVEQPGAATTAPLAAAPVAAAAEDAGPAPEEGEDTAEAPLGAMPEGPGAPLAGGTTGNADEESAGAAPDFDSADYDE